LTKVKKLTNVKKLTKVKKVDQGKKKLTMAGINYKNLPFGQTTYFSDKMLLHILANFSLKKFNPLTIKW
jgi:hypothetical protein